MRAFLIVILALLVAMPASGQTRTVVTNTHALIQMPTMRTATTSAWFDVTAYGVTDHTLSLVGSSPPTSITVSLECSRDGSTSAGIVGTSTNVSGAVITGSMQCSHVRVNIRELTGTTILYPVWIGMTAGADTKALAAILAELRAIHFNDNTPRLPLPKCNAVRKTNCK
jgi:hypothetical protein